MCVLLKLHYARFDVSSLFCSKVMEENFWLQAGNKLDTIKGVLLDND